MVRRDLNNIFLSASIPFKDRHPIYYDTADVVAIRDSIRALATIAVPNLRIIFGGHPSITPLIHSVLKTMTADISSHVKLYQSLFFKDLFPIENEDFTDIVEVPKSGDLDASLLKMRQEMICKNQFCAAVFIGGMEGILAEHKIFTEHHKTAKILPIATTGAATGLLYKQLEMNDPKLENDYSYLSLFRECLSEWI